MASLQQGGCLRLATAQGQKAPSGRTCIASLPVIEQQLHFEELLKYMIV